MRKEILYRLRRYPQGNAAALAEVFRAAVRGTACCHYTPAQIDAWAASAPSLAGREEWFLQLYTVVAEQDGCPVAYGNIDDTGYLDHLFVHPKAAGQGSALAICARLEGWAAGRGIPRLTVHAARTAKPFFEKRGWRATAAQQVPLRGEMPENFAMEYIV